MKETTIIVTISPEGTISADADGFTGDACLKDLERLLEGLAPGTATVARKPPWSDCSTARPWLRSSR